MTRKLKKSTDDNPKLESSRPDDVAVAVAAAAAVPFWKLFSYADSFDYVLMGLGTFGAIGHGMVVPINMLVFGRILNSLGTHGRQDPQLASVSVAKLALVLMCIALAAACVAWIEVACWMLTGERQSARIRAKYLQALLNQDITYYDTAASTGEIVNRIAGDTLLVHEAMGEKVGAYQHSMTGFIGGILVGLFNCWQLTLLSFATIPLIAGAGAVYTKLYVKYTSKAQVSYSQAGSIAEQAMAQVRTVYSFVGEMRVVAAFSKILQPATKLCVKASLVKGIGLGITLGIINGSWALQLWYGGILVAGGKTNGGKILTTVFCVVLGGIALGTAAPDLERFARGRIAAFPIFEMIERQSTIDVRNVEGDIPAGQFKGAIELVDVRFSYPSRPNVPIFTGLSLTIPAGESLALVGCSGSGKSTIVSLIERFYDPISGEVRVDGRNIKTLQLKWLRSRIGLVGQEPVLFATTIRENILYGRSDASDMDIKAAAIASNAHSFITKLPQGYDTQVGARGTQLSGGQKQRVAIARAVLKCPTILLLDEATSALDAASERVVQDALDKLMEGRTTVVVAHRLSTVQKADSIAVFQKGQVVERGTHSDLLRNSDGVYTSLVNLQETAKKEEPENQDWPTLSSAISASPAWQSTTVYNSLAASPLPTWRWLPESPIYISLAFSPPPAERTSVNQIVMEAPEKSFIASPQRKRLTWDLRTLGIPDCLSLLLGSLAATITGCINPLFALFMIEVASSYYIPGSSSKINSYCLIIACLGVTNLTTNTLQHYQFGKTAERISSRMREMTFKAIMRSEVGWFDLEENASSAVTGRLASGATKVRSSLSDRASLLLQYISSMSLAIILSFTIEWRMALLTVATFPFAIFGGSMKQGFFQRGFSGNLQKSHENATNLAGEAVSNIRTVASFGAEEKILALFNKHLEEPLRKIKSNAVTGGLMFGLSQAALHLANALGLWYISVLVSHGRVPYIKALKVFQILAMSGFALGEALNLIPDIRDGLNAATSLLQMIDRKTEMDPDDPKVCLKLVKGQLELCNLVFRYPSRPNVLVLDNFKLKVKAGTTVALVGSSGSGKSSIISLIERFYDPISGKILLDGRDIRSLNLRWLRQQIGLVQQEPALFGGSIKSNILYGKDEAGESEVMEAAIAANAHTFISNLPNGYDTQVGERGLQLSGGQKQRIAIARAVLKDPAILLLDEATSALDAESERTVQAALNTIMQGTRTTVVVAHRLSTIQNADVIAVVNSGRVVEQGSHRELMAAGGAYAQLVQLQ